MPPYSYSMRKFQILIVLLLLSSGALFSIESNISENVRFHSYSVEDGLLTNTVYTIFQDRKGFLWFGTQDGVNRFDGVDFVAIAPGSAASRGLIYQIAEDPEANILIASTNGLYRYSQESESVDLFHESLKSQEVKRFLSLSLEKTLLFLAGKGLYLLESDKLSPLVQNVTISDMVFKAGLVYAATDRGVLIYNLESKSTEEILMQDREVLSLLSEGDLIIAGTDRGIYSISSDRSTKLIIEDAENVNSLLRDTQSRLWTGSDTNGLAHYCEDFSQSCRFLNGDTVMSLFIDHSDNLWVGYLGAGLKRVDTHRLGFSYLGKDKGLENTIVVSLWEDEDNSLWVGTFGGGLFHFSKDKALIKRYSYDPEDPDYSGDSRIMGLFRDRRGRMWIGTKNKGMFYLENDKFVSVEGSYGSIYTISEDERGMIWAITQGGGVHIIDPVSGITETLLPPYVPTRSFRTMLIEGDRVYLGTVDAGLLVLNLDGRLLAHYAPESFSSHGLKGAHVLSLNIDRDGTLWVGTLDGGLHRYNQEADNFKRYTESEGLPNNTVYGILEDEKGRLWISTNRGLALFNPDDEMFTVYTVADGLQSNEFNSGASFKGKSSTLYMGGVHGLTFFDSSLITENRTVPETLIAKLSINNRDISVGETVQGVDVLPSSISGLQEIVLTQDHLVLTLHFRALHYSDPEGNRYSYILEGLESEWTDAGKRNFSTYTSLPPGDYTFRVKSMSSNGIWSEENSLRILVEPEYYQTTWFRILLIAVFLSSLLLLIKNRLNKAAEKNILLEKMVTERTLELETALDREKEMRDYLSNNEKMSSIVSLTARLAHNLNTPLGSTTTALSFLKSSLEQGQGEATWIETCDIALDGTNKAAQIVQQLSAASSARALPTPVLFNLSKVLNEYINSQWIPLFDKKGIQCILDLDETDSRLMGSISSLQETIDCLFSNALEHAFNSESYNSSIDFGVKKVTLKTVYSEKEALLIYRDNGQGISKELQRKIFEPFEGSSPGGKSRGMGLFLVYNLIKIHFAGQISLLEEAEGVCFQIKFPLKLNEE
jgi:ligand-binding sensor domain-containing protein/signal transduction histidine kinase